MKVFWLLSLLLLCNIFGDVQSGHRHHRDHRHQPDGVYTVPEVLSKAINIGQCSRKLKSVEPMYEGLDQVFLPTFPSSGAYPIMRNITLTFQVNRKFSAALRNQTISTLINFSSILH